VTVKREQPHTRGPKPTVYTVGEESRTLREWAETLDVPIKRLRYLTRNDPVAVLAKLAEHRARRSE
jgi:hypothetical protein